MTIADYIHTNQLSFKVGNIKFIVLSFDDYTEDVNYKFIHMMVIDLILFKDLKKQKMKLFHYIIAINYMKSFTTHFYTTKAQLGFL